MRKPLLDEGTRCFLKGVTPIIILPWAVVTFLLWLITSFNAHAATRQERSVPYDRLKEYSTSMLYYPEQPMVEWDLKPYLDFIEGGNAAATPAQWARALHQKGKIDEPTWAKARQYLTTLKWQKNATKEWYRMFRVIRPYGKWQAGRLDSGYERAFEVGEWGLHDPKTGELIVAGDCGNVVVEKLGAAIAAPAPTPAPPPQPAEPTRVVALPPPPDQPAAPQATVADETQPYIIDLVRDPENLLVAPGTNSRDVRKFEQAQALFAQGKVSAASGRNTFRVVFYAKGMNGKPLAAYDVPVSDGRGLLRVPRSQVEQAGSMTMEAPDELKPRLKYPLSGMLDWYDWELLHVVRGRPKHGWFVLK